MYPTTDNKMMRQMMLIHILDAPPLSSRARFIFLFTCNKCSFTSSAFCFVSLIIAFWILSSVFISYATAAAAAAGSVHQCTTSCSNGTTVTHRGHHP